MARDLNFLLGRGERLAREVHVKPGGGTKNPPYDLSRALSRLEPRLRTVTRAVASLPPEALFDDEAVVTVTMHPRYVAKSDFPQGLLSAFGLRPVGSRSRVLAPENWGIDSHGDTGLAEDIFVAGRRSAFGRWADQLDQWAGDRTASKDLCHVEDIHQPAAGEKLQGDDVREGLIEVVLHRSVRDGMVQAFAQFARDRDAEVVLELRRDVGGLTFLPVRAHRGALSLADFSFVRIIRAMPRLRPVRTPQGRAAGRARLALPDATASGDLERVVVFDGGIPKEVRGELAPWVTVIEPPGIGPADPEREEHGLAVTGALLFGPVHHESPLTTPVCAVDHVRVLDTASDDPGDAATYVVLDRIVNHLKNNPGKYRLANISLGPDGAVEDDDVSLWTSTLDALAADGDIVISVASGNDGSLDRDSGLHRIQPPADGVNVLSVGAADRVDLGWDRAYYSSFGPGRCPGIVKPDGLAFGGGDVTPFPCVSRQLGVDFVTGTSFAAPYALRSAAAVQRLLGRQLSPLAIRALLIHRAERPESLDWREVGWGRFSNDADFSITCNDDEAVVVYQGELPIGEHLRLLVPIPAGGISGPLTLRATLVIASEVDAEHAASYTRSGLEATFRPDRSKVRTYKSGRQSEHGASRAFFSSTRLYGRSEAELRSEAHKWELVRRGERKITSGLNEPCFDVYYHTRADGRATADALPVRFAFILEMRAPGMANLYNEVVRSYARILEPLRPQLRLQLPGSGTGAA